jgi:polyribonucleotide 5'-hydroxyl-kinase
MVRKFGNNRSDAITLVRLDKSGGCVDRDNEFMKNTQELSIREYFFGDLKRTLSPHIQQLNFDEVVIYQIRQGEDAFPCKLSYYN